MKMNKKNQKRKRRVDFIRDNIEKKRSDQESFASQQELISNINANTHDEEATEEQFAKKHLSDIASLGHKIEGVSRERRELEDR